jgi:hypothetical protein
VLDAQLVEHAQRRAGEPAQLGVVPLALELEMTTSGRTTSCSSNRVSDHGSDSRTEVSST